MLTGDLAAPSKLVLLNPSSPRFLFSLKHTHHKADNSMELYMFSGIGRRELLYLGNSMIYILQTKGCTQKILKHDAEHTFLKVKGITQI
jgi:hypothetical protein